ncbi:MAG: hypothetical protein LBN19_01560 [Endomicrobium sp.]|jgi:hypothetical protein|nr:hypothetical protein [Endomicrobium sp.]
MLQSGYQEYPKKLEAVKSAFTKCLETRCTIDEKVLRAGLGTTRFQKSEFKDIAFIRNEQKKLAVINTSSQEIKGI